MCWPPGCRSSIHDHAASSCWVVLVEGEVVEVSYALPKMDLAFSKVEMENPSGAVGRCGRLQKLGESVLSEAGGHPGGYVNNDLGIHAIENRRDTVAYTLHVYAPGLKRMRIFTEEGRVKVVDVPGWGADAERRTECIVAEPMVDADWWNSLEQ